jgi:putative MFS transporter
MAFLAVGYVFGALTYALGLVTDEYKLSSFWQGLVTAGQLVGIFFGAIIGSRLADRYGRRVVLQYTLFVTTIAAAAYFLVNNQETLLLVRGVVGFGLGVILSVAAPLLSEFAPRKHRTAILSYLNIVWFLGYMIAYYSALLLSEQGVSWRWLLASSFVPMAIAFFLTLGTSESLRWLMSRGRVEEARSLVKRHYGQDYDVDDLVVPDEKKVSYAGLFGKRYRARTAFSCIFYTAQVTVFFAVYLYLPRIVDALGLPGNTLTYLIVDVVTLAAYFLGLYISLRIRRRPWVIWSFWICVIAPVVLAVNSLPLWIAAIAFTVFIVISNAASNLEFVYPPEIFPTEVRSSGMGLTVATARIGSILSVWVLPSLLVSLGISWTMVLLGAVSAIGAVASMLWAPETKDLTLAQASGEAEAASGSSVAASSLADAAQEA